MDLINYTLIYEINYSVFNFHIILLYEILFSFYYYFYKFYQLSSNYLILLILL